MGSIEIVALWRAESIVFPHMRKNGVEMQVLGELGLKQQKAGDWYLKIYNLQRL